MDPLRKFIADNIGESPTKLRLKYHGKSLPFDTELAITQIECRQRFGKKLSHTLADNPDFIFPSVLAGEQSTSDRLARWHARHITPGTRVIDCTAGLGIDTMHMHKRGALVTAIDIDPDKCRALQANCPGVNVVCADSREYLAALPANRADIIYIDPARRSEQNQRLFALAECAPDVTAMLWDMSRVAPRLIVKASPMIDITHTALALPGITSITALGTSTECKELVCEVNLRRTPLADAEYTIHAVTLTADGETRVECTASEQKQAAAATALPQPGQTLYEPYPAAMKASVGDLVAVREGLSALHPNTHLYVGEAGRQFPGRAYTIVGVMPFESRVIKRLKRIHPAMQVAVRNFGMSADALRRRLGVSEGDETRLYGVTLCDNSQALLLCRPAEG